MKLFFNFRVLSRLSRAFEEGIARERRETTRKENGNIK